jgi:transposase-like protein
MAIGASEAEPFWTDFLRSLMRRGLRGVKLVISDAHVGIRAAVAKVLKSTWHGVESITPMSRLCRLGAPGPWVRGRTGF